MTNPAPRVRAASPDRWLSLGPASRLLGVDPDTLRRWADAGRIATWTTPGGHRRFERSALERLAAERRPTTVPIPFASLGGSPAHVFRVYRRHYARPSARPIVEAPRDAFERDAYRTDGRRLVAVLVEYLDAAGDAGRRRRLRSDAEVLVDDHAARLVRAGQELTSSVALFVAARRPFLAAIADLGRRRALDPARLAAVYDDASVVLDRLLLRFIATHQGASRRS